MVYLFALLVAYLVGAFPSGVVVVRIVRGIDVRRIGSRRSGATNVMRAAGPLSGAAVLLLDLAKGAVPVWLGLWLGDPGAGAAYWSSFLGFPAAWPLPAEMLSPLWVGMFCGLAAIAGHNWPVYIRFRGGRGVSTSVGTLIPLAPFVAAGVFLAGVLVIALTRYVSLGSMTGAGLTPVGLLLQACFVPVPIPLILYGALIGGMIIFQHYDNLVRLLTGKERRLGDPVKVPPPDPPGGAGSVGDG